MRSLFWILVPGYRALRRGDRRRAFRMQAVFMLVVLLAFATPWLHSPLGLVSFLALLLGGLAWCYWPARARGEPVRLATWEWRSCAAGSPAKARSPWLRCSRPTCVAAACGRRFRGRRPPGSRSRSSRGRRSRPPNPLPPIARLRRQESGLL